MNKEPKKVNVLKSFKFQLSYHIKSYYCSKEILIGLYENYKSEINQIEKNKDYNAYSKLMIEDISPSETLPAIIMLLSFTVELQLKKIIISSIVVLDDNKIDYKLKRCHDLKKLFKKIDKTIQKELMDLMFLDEKEFNDELDKYSNLFVDYRYYYEEQKKELEDQLLSGNFKNANNNYLSIWDRRNLDYKFLNELSRILYKYKY